MIDIKRQKHLNLALLVLWLILIFIMSSFNAGESSSQSGSIVTFVGNILNIDNLQLLSVLIRKLAHFTEYFILGILTINCFKDYKLNNIYIYSLLFCIFYACTDEIHQLFVPGRSGNIIDVLIDSFGSLIGCSSYFLLLKNKKNSKI